jgi:hypothetical protein
LKDAAAGAEAVSNSPVAGMLKITPACEAAAVRLTAKKAAPARRNLIFILS